MNGSISALKLPDNKQTGARVLARDELEDHRELHSFNSEYCTTVVGERTSSDNKVLTTTNSSSNTLCARHFAESHQIATRYTVTLANLSLYVSILASIPVSAGYLAYRRRLGPIGRKCCGCDLLLVASPIGEVLRDARALA